ncbi:MAG: nuclease (SNase protein) [Acidobacteria bacterium]|nr:nuclease (SNase protein) [Acidobacteriota bacterium]
MDSSLEHSVCRRCCAALTFCALLIALVVLIVEVERVPLPGPARTLIASAAPAPELPPVAAARGVAPAPAGEAAVAAGYVGNTNTHRFHRMSCGYASCRNCTAKFSMREEAIAAGFRPGGCCNP